MIKIQKLILAALFITVAVPAFANSEIGISASLNSNALWTGVDYYDERSTSNVMGYSITIPYQYNFNNQLSLRTELRYITRNYTQDTYQNIDNSITSENNYNSYFEIPLMGRIYLGHNNNPFKLFINLGGYYSYWLTSSTSGKYINLSNITGVNTSDESYYSSITTDGFDKNDNRNNFGFLGGIGFEVQIQQHLKASFETRIKSDITSIYSTDQINAVDEFNNTIEGNFTFIYSL
jgi:hypothetical protein